MKVTDRDIKITGLLIRIARIDGDKYRFLDNPEPIIEGLRRLGTRVDLFTFMQPLADASPRHSYPMEWDNFAVIHVTTFEKWWSDQIGFKARNKAKQAEKRGVVLQEVPFSDELARGIWEIYN